MPDIMSRGTAQRWAKKNTFFMFAALLACGAPACAAEDTSVEMLTMIMEFLRSPDRDTRGLALQQVREGLPGSANTLKLAEALSTLGPESEAALIEALADRGDSAARNGIRAAVETTNLVVRVSAIRALGRLGNGDDVSRLTRVAAGPAGADQEAARSALSRLPGVEVNLALLRALEQGDARARVELMPVVATRGVTHAAPVVLALARAPEPEVRRAALKAGETLASSRDLSALIQLLHDATTEMERDAIEAVLLAVSRREPGACLAPALAAFPTAAAETQVCLLRLLSAIGGAPALQATVDATGSVSLAVQREAVRLLSEWPDPAAFDPLLRVAEKPALPLYSTLAFRGLVRLVGNTEGREADVRLLERIWRLAAEADEKRLFLGAMANIARPTSGTVLLAARGLEDSAVRDEAVLAVATLAGKLKPSDLASVQLAVTRAWELSEAPDLRQQLESLRAAAQR